MVHRFNKREDDFPSLKDYNDYLEEVEDMSKLIEYLTDYLIFHTVSFFFFFFRIGK